MEIIKDLITKDKINDLISGIGILSESPNNISDVDYVESIIDALEDIINNPYTYNLDSIKELVETDQPCALDDMTLMSECTVMSMKLDNIIQLIGSKLNTQVAAAKDFLTGVDKSLQIQLDRLITIEDSLFEQSNNTSIHDDKLFKKNDQSTYEGNVTLRPYISLLPSKIRRLKPNSLKNTDKLNTIKYNISNFKIHITNIDGSNDKLLVDFDSSYGKSDADLFQAKYFNGRSQPTIKTGTSYQQDNVTNLFDDNLSWGEWESLDFLNSKTNKEFKVRITFDILAPSSSEIKLTSLTNAAEKLSILYHEPNSFIPSEQKNQWITINESYSELSNNDLAKTQVNQIYYHFPSYHAKKINVEMIYTTTIFDLLESPRYIMKNDNITKRLNLIETYLFSISGIIDNNINQLFEENSFDSFISFNASKNNLLDKNLSFVKNIEDSTVDFIQFKRYAISLLNFDIFEVDYDINSTEYISDAFISDYSIKTLQLSVDVKVNNSNSDNLFEYFKYYLSPDKINWYQIKPVGQISNINNISLPERIIYNGSFEETNVSQTIDTDYDKQVYLKIVISKNEYESTPIISDYKIIAKV